METFKERMASTKGKNGKGRIQDTNSKSRIKISGRNRETKNELKYY